MGAGVLYCYFNLFNSMGGVPIITKIEELHDQVILFKPIYHNGANAAELIVNDNNTTGPLIDRRSITSTSVKKALAHCYAVDLSAQGQMLKIKLKRYPPLPFYLPDGNSLTSLKGVSPTPVSSAIGIYSTSLTTMLSKPNRSTVFTQTFLLPFFLDTVNSARVITL